MSLSLLLSINVGASFTIVALTISGSLGSFEYHSKKSITYWRLKEGDLQKKDVLRFGEKRFQVQQVGRAIIADAELGNGLRDRFEDVEEDDFHFLRCFK